MKLLPTVFLLCISSIAFAQSKTNWGFMNGVIHLKKGDSIVGLVEKQVVYDQTLFYRLSDHGKIEEIPTAQVNYFKAGDKIFESVALYGSHTIMELLDTGKLSLYTFNEIKYGATERDRNTGLKTKNGVVVIHYVVKQTGNTQEIKEPTFKAVLRQLFSACQRMAGKITRGDYLFEDMPQVVKDYNNCKGAYCDHTTARAQGD